MEHIVDANLFHKRIVSEKPIPNTITGKVVTLECGHTRQIFGKQGELVVCPACRDAIVDKLLG